MSSKVFRGGEGPPVEPMTWRRAPLPLLDTKPNLYSAPAGSSAAEPAPEALLQEIDAREKASHRRGYQEGEAAAHQAAAAQVQAERQKLGDAIRQLSGYRAQLRRDAEADLVRLAIAIARKILRRELSVDPEALAGIARSALDRLAAKEGCRVRIHPSHAEAVARYVENSGARAEVIADRALEPGGAVFESVAGSLDASIESQLAEIERGLTDLCRR